MSDIKADLSKAEAAIVAGAPGFWAKYKWWILGVLAAILLFGGGYGTARISGPAKVVTKTETVTKTQEKIVYQDRVVTKVVYVKAEKTHTHTETVATKQKDGSEVVKTVVDNNTDENTSENKDVTNDKSKVTTQVVYQDRIVTKTVESKKPDWMVNAGVGVSIPSALGSTQMGVPGLHSYVIEADVNRRIIGPVFMGVWGNTQGTLGLKIGGLF